MTRSMKLLICIGLGAIALGVTGTTVLAGTQTMNVPLGVVQQPWAALSSDEKLAWLKTAYEDENRRAEGLAVKNAALERRIRALEERPTSSPAHCNTLTTVRELKQNAGYDPFTICLNHP